MKRIILLLLVFCCFRFSYAEELTAEQQQLAWKFIYYKALSKDNCPIVFKDDIIINLKGKVTSDDSMIVKDIIKDFQKAIPHLKISLSDSPGNLILGLDLNKVNSITSNLNTFEIQSRKSQFSLPDNLTSYERKQFIYYQLCNGIVFFNYNKSPEKILGLNGCVFAENDFKSITFSPFDLFILEMLYSPDFSIQLARNLDTGMQQTAWSSIIDKFMDDTAKEPIIYRTDIAIKLEGKVSSEDSVCLNELIHKLNLIIPNRKIFMTAEKANVNFNFLESGSGVGSSMKIDGSSIQNQKIDLFFPSNTSNEDKKRVLYFNLTRSLVGFSPSKYRSTDIFGCVFNENKPENITYHPVDAFILSTLYANDFQTQFKKYWIKKWPARAYYSFMYFIQLRTAGIITGILLAIFLLSVLIKRGIFAFHNWRWNRFIIQIFWIAIIYGIYTTVNLVIRHLSFQFFLFEPNFFRSFVFINLSILLVPTLFFVTERKLNTLDVAAKNKLLFLITNSILISFLLSFVYLFVYNRNEIDFKLTISVGVSFVFASVRFLLFTFSELKKNEQREKDIEFTILKEKSKQAELDSLRAKINPHFLYNALNSIASLASTDARKTEQMALALSDFFKYAINREQKQLNTLSEELNAIRTYLEIEKVRFGERLSFEIDCPEELLEIQIPQLLIQPLVENAIKHGLSQITENGLIGILVCKEENQLKIRVYDNGPAFPDGPLSGFGIQNTQERIALLYGAKATINWQNGPEKYVEISIPV